jgi:hypothetical protein
MRFQNWLRIDERKKDPKPDYTLDQFIKGAEKLQKDLEKDVKDSKKQEKDLDLEIDKKRKEKEKSDKENKSDGKKKQPSWLGKAKDQPEDQVDDGGSSMVGSIDAEEEKTPDWLGKPQWKSPWKPNKKAPASKNAKSR